MSAPPRTREWLRSFLKLGARHEFDEIPLGDVERQEDTVLAALRMLDQQPGVVLADEVGMGKTFEALGVIAAYREANPDNHVVVITPGPDLNTKWRNEFARFEDRRAQFYNFGGELAAVYGIGEFFHAVRTKRMVVAPVNIFAQGRSGADKALLLALYCRWKGLPWQTERAIANRITEERADLPRIDLTRAKFLDHVSVAELEPHLDGAFRRNDEPNSAAGLDDLFEEHGTEAFRSTGAVRGAMDLAKFRLMRALMPDQALLVVDEAHKLKNATTVRSRAVSTLFRRKFGKALFLTATPFQLGIEELRQVFSLFSLAKSAPPDLIDRADTLLADVRDYQHAYDALQQAWRRVDPGLAEEFRALSERDPELVGPFEDPNVRVIAERVRQVLKLKRDKIEPGFRAWMIRSLSPEKRVYRRHDTRKLMPAGPRSLPFLVYERFIAELFRHREQTYKAAVEINMVSSYGAARKGALLSDGEERSLPGDAGAYRALLREVIDELRGGTGSHPKLGHVVEDAIAAAEKGEKTLIFCARLETLAELSREIGAIWESKVLELWRRVYPDAEARDIFDATENDERSRGRHSRLQARFHRTQDALYLALRERYVQSLLYGGTAPLDHLDVIVERANAALHQVRTGSTSAARIDYQIAKRCVEHAVALEWRDRQTALEPDQKEALEALCSPEFVRYGLDLVADDYEPDHSGDHTPSWTISHDVASTVLAHRSHLWAFLARELAMTNTPLPFTTRVELVERVARFLTRKEVPFLAELLGAAKAAGIDVEEIESRALLDFVDRFWPTPAGRPWLHLLRRFVKDFVTREQRLQEFILRDALDTGQFVRQTREGESRERLREAFNTPLYPMVLIANEVMQEGLDLHRQCRRVIHHDLAWNPAQLEQRVGRVDRLGSLVRRLRKDDQSTTLDVVYPLIMRTIDQRLYRTVKAREKWLEFLLGATPDLAEFELEEDLLPLPPSLAERLRVDLSPSLAWEDATARAQTVDTDAPQHGLHAMRGSE